MSLTSEQRKLGVADRELWKSMLNDEFVISWPCCFQLLYSDTLHFNAFHTIY